MIKVLVAYGSKHGGTAEIAEWIAAALRGRGLQADVKSGAEVEDVRPYDAVIIGGALYAGMWHKNARKLIRRHLHDLKERPVWLFSSGPLDHSADDGKLEQAKGVTKAAERLGARGDACFGGFLASDAEGMIASAMAKKLAGDYRDRDQIAAWAAGIAGELVAERSDGHAAHHGSARQSS
jgi:menaquinone-dependent protoporphyrinogen oxidase